MAHVGIFVFGKGGGGLTRFEAGSPLLSRERTETAPKLHYGTAPNCAPVGAQTSGAVFPSIALRGCNPPFQRPAQDHPAPNLIAVQS